MFGKLLNTFKWFSRGSGRLSREIIVNCEKLETRVAVVENGKLEEFQVERPDEERLVGSVYKARIQNLENDLQAAFVNIGMKKNAFLHYWDMNPDDESLLDDEDNPEVRSENNKKRGGGRGRPKYTNEEIAKKFPAGSVVTVQVSKGPIGTKGPRVTASLSMPGKYLVMMPGASLRGVSRKVSDKPERDRLKKILDKLVKIMPDDCGLIVRTAGIGAKQTAFVRDLRVLLNSYADMRKAIAEQPAPCVVYSEPDLVLRMVREWMTEDVDRIIIDDAEVYEKVRKEAARISRRAKNLVQHYEGHFPIFDHFGVEQQIEEAFRRKVLLPSGGYLIIDETEAMIAVDVNTGKFKGKGSQEDAILNVNLEAVAEVARQLRLRNIGGLVVLDLIDMKSRKHQQQVHRTLKMALKRDKARTNVLPISELGILEMTRQRFEESLLSQMHQDCPYCSGKGFIKSSLHISVDIQRRLSSLIKTLKKQRRDIDLQVSVHPVVLERLKTEDAELLGDLQQEYKGRLSFKSDPLRNAETFAVIEAATGQNLYVSGGSNAQ